MKKTKIICTMGPNTSDKNIMMELARNGMDVARFNFSHGDYNEHQGRLELLKEVRKELDIPVIVHTREAANDTLELLKKYRPKGIVHCFSGSVEMAKEVLRLDMYIGFTGVLTFKNARKAVEVVQYAPADRLLLETDCPYMAPVPNRGKRNSSLYLPEVVKTIAEIKGISCEEVVAVTESNAMKVLGLV